MIADWTLFRAFSAPNNITSRGLILFSDWWQILVRFPNSLGCELGERTPWERGILLQRILALKMLIIPPHISYIIGFCNMWARPGHCQNLGKSLLVAARADLGAHPICPLMHTLFVHSPFPSFSTDFPISVLHISFPLLSSLIFRVLHDIQCAKLVIFSVISCDERFSALVLFKLNSVDGRGQYWKRCGGGGEEESCD